METAGFVVLYWHWIVLGIGLMALEMVLPSFVSLWFGAAAVIVGLILLAMPELSLAVQVVLWVIFSILMTILWFKFIQPHAKDRTKAGLSREAMLGEAGQVISLPSGSRRGQLRFPAPILGSDEWMFICETDETLQLGDRVRVVEISGNSLVVVKV